MKRAGLYHLFFVASSVPKRSLSPQRGGGMRWSHPYLSPPLIPSSQ